MKPVEPVVGVAQTLSPRKNVEEFAVPEPSRAAAYVPDVTLLAFVASTEQDVEAFARFEQEIDPIAAPPHVLSP